MAGLFLFCLAVVGCVFITLMDRGFFLLYENIIFPSYFPFVAEKPRGQRQLQNLFSSWIFPNFFQQFMIFLGI